MMNFTFIVFVITLCFPAYKTGASEPNMANADKPTEPVLPDPKDNKEDYSRFREYWKAQKEVESILSKYFDDKELKQFKYKQNACVNKTFFKDSNNDQKKQYQIYDPLRKSAPLKLVRFVPEELEQFACWDIESYKPDPNENPEDSSPRYNTYVNYFNTLKDEAFEDLRFSSKEQYRYPVWYNIYNSEVLSNSDTVTNLNSDGPLDFSTVTMSFLPDPRNNEKDYNRFKEYWQEEKSLESTLDKEFTAENVKRYAYWHFKARDPMLPRLDTSNKEDSNRYIKYLSARKLFPLQLANTFPFNDLNRYAYWSCTGIIKPVLLDPKDNQEDLNKYNTYVNRQNSLEVELSDKFGKDNTTRYEYWYDIYNSEVLSQNKVVLDLEGKSTEPLDFSNPKTELSRYIDIM